MPDTSDSGSGTDAADAPEHEPDAAELEAEVERLRAENERLHEQVDHEAAPSGPRHRVRWVASLALIVIGSLLVPVSVVSLWLDRTITDSDRYVETVTPLAKDPAIQKAVSARLEQALFANVDIEAEVKQVLPDRATVLAAPITTGVKSLASDLINRAVTSDRFAELWVTANRAAQKQVVSVLTNSSGKKGVVEIDLTGTAKEISSRLSGLGVPFFADLGSKPVTFEVFQSDEVAQVQQAFNLFDKLATILPWLTLLILGAGILLAPNRRKGLVYAATGWVIALRPAAGGGRHRPERLPGGAPHRGVAARPTRPSSTPSAGSSAAGAGRCWSWGSSCCWSCC